MSTASSSESGSLTLLRSRCAAQLALGTSLVTYIGHIATHTFCTGCDVQRQVGCLLADNEERSLSRGGDQVHTLAHAALSGLTQPAHTQVRAFSEAVCKNVEGYDLACEHEHSNLVLLAKKQFKVHSKQSFTTFMQGRHYILQQALTRSTTPDFLCRRLRASGTRGSTTPSSTPCTRPTRRRARPSPPWSTLQRHQRYVKPHPPTSVAHHQPYVSGCIPLA